jgi:hypothetical protein
MNTDFYPGGFWTMFQVFWWAFTIAWILLGGMVGLALSRGNNKWFCFFLSICFPFFGWLISAIVGNRGDNTSVVPSGKTSTNDPFASSARRLMAKYKPRTRVVFKGVHAAPAAPQLVEQTEPCPECRQPVLVDGLQAGRVYACPHCKGKFAAG